MACSEEVTCHVHPFYISIIRRPFFTGLGYLIAVSSNIVSTPLALSIALQAIRPTAVSGTCGSSLTALGESPDDYIRSDLSATPPTRKRPVQLSTVSSSIILSLHGKCTPEDNDGVLELRRVAGLNPSTRMPYIRNTHRRPDKSSQLENSSILLGSLPMTRSALVVP